MCTAKIAPPAGPDSTSRTGKRIAVSTVVNPPPDRVAESRRQSVVFFQNPNYDAVVSCLPSCADGANQPKYPPTTAGGHLREKSLSTQQAIAYVD